MFAITGGAGFIGSHLADALLTAGYGVRIIDDFSTGRIANVDPRCEVIRGDVCDQTLVRRSLFGVSGCFHLAAIASVARANQDWLGTHRTNLGGFISVMDASRQLGGIPVVYASSAAAYGRVSGVASEDVLPAPMTAYGADKLACEHHARAGSLVHGIPALGFRFFNVYGPRQDPFSPYSGVISIFCRAIAAGRPIEIHGTGEQTRDFVYVADIVRLLVAGMNLLRDGRAVEDTAGLALNACTGHRTSIVDLASTIGQVLSCAPQMRFGPGRPGDIEHSLGSPKLAEAVLGLRPQTSLRDGLTALLGSLGSHEPLLQA